MNSPLPAAVLWDMDGTLVDTEPLWIAAERGLVESHGSTWTEADSRALVGSDLLTAGAYIRDRAALPMTPAAVVEHLVAEVLRGVSRGVGWRPGARELLYGLRALDVPCALVTMSYRPLADAVTALLVPGTFAAVITGDEVTHGKPHPEPYLSAAAQLGVEPSECVVIEDSETGAAAGSSAGARVIGVPNVVPVTSRPGVVITDSLVHLDPAGLLAMFDRTETTSA